jgi:flagellar hook protein FlgE
MGISQSMFTGVTGLSAMADNMSVVANNIANSNSKGFKYDRAEFQDLLSQDLGGSGQLGRGVRMSDIRTMHTQGGLQVTDNLSDLAVQGDGFFIVRNSNTEVQESGGAFFTRVGSFHFDKDGYLADSTGGHVQGYMADRKGDISTKLTDIRIQTNNLPPMKTGTMTLNVNLDSRAKVIEDDFDLNNAEKTSNFNTTVATYDSHGRAHQTTVYFRRMDDDDGISWQWHACVDSKETTDGDPDYALKEIAAGTVKFNNNGNLVEEITDFSEANFAEGAFPAQEIKFDFGKNMGEEGGNGVGASSSTAARSTTVFHNQDGYEAGNLKMMKIELDGTVLGIYTNGIQRSLGQVAMATFENRDGLAKAGRNQFIATIESGPAKIGAPQTGTLGSVYSSTLEESNVDLASQFVNMILTQRGFQANSRSVTTTDQMMEEVINLKR